MARFALLVSALALVLPVSARAQTPPVAAPPMSAPDSDETLAAAADEYVADTMQFGPERLARIRSGQILPGCRVTYPTLGTMIGSDTRGPSPARIHRVQLAVDSAIVKQNLIELGLEEKVADYYAANLLKERVQYERLPAARQTYLFNHQNSPKHRIAGYIAAIVHKPAGFPQIQPPESCGEYAYLTFYTPYRLRLQPAAGRVFVLPRFSFRLCELRQVDPYDRAQCPDWIDVSGQAANLLGRYAVSAEWSDGGLNRGVRDFVYVDKTEHAIDLYPTPPGQ